MDTMRTIVPQVRAEYPSLKTKPNPLRQWVAWILHGFEVRRSRNALLELTDEQLRDIGLNPDEAAREAKRPIWDRNSPFGW